MGDQQYHVRQEEVAREPENLVHVKVYASGIINAPLTNVWALVRCFSQISQWLPERDDGLILETSLLVSLGE